MSFLSAILLSTLAASPAPPETAANYRTCVVRCLDNILEHGRDHYGEVPTPMIMSLIDIATQSAPWEPLPLDGLVRCEGRQHRRNPGGCDLWEDQPLLATMHAVSEETGKSQYAEAADAYTQVFFELSRKDNGLLAWGSHIFYDAYTDRPGGDQDGKGPHEILVLLPEWERMWKVAPDALRAEIEGIWEWHVVDKQTGLHNRHDDKAPGCDFAFSGGTFVQAFGFLYAKTRDPKYLEWAKIVAGRHWNARNPDTNLTPDAPGTGDRYDAHHCFTTIPGPHAAALLRTYELTGDTWFKDLALAYIRAYLKYGWDPKAERWLAMLTLDGSPVMEQAKGEGYDAYKPTGHVDTWPVIMFSYEFPLIAAQTAVYAHELTGDPDALECAHHWAEQIRKDLPADAGQRWRKELFEALPDAERLGGTYAENYGRAIDFFWRYYRITGSQEDRDTALALADEAIAKLRTESGWFRGHPAKPYYESTDGVGILLNALWMIGTE